MCIRDRSGSDRHIETMSLSRRAISEGQRALIVDDFLKGGGTAKGMIELMAEFNVEVVGTAFVLSTENPNQRCIHDEKALMTMNVTDDPASLTGRPAPVSYTHLDVYKRQTGYIRRAVCRCLLILTASSSSRQSFTN